MKNRLWTAAVGLLTVLVLLGGGLPVSAESPAQGQTEAGLFLDGILSYEWKETGCTSVQQWIDGRLTDSAGACEWYTIALSQYGSYDFTAYGQALSDYLSSNEVGSAASRQKYALALIAAGRNDSYIYDTLNDSIGRQGVMSWIFGLHLLNNGYRSTEYSAAEVRQKLLALQLADGGWAVTGSVADVDVTAMALQALAPYYPSDTAVKTAADRALALLSERQSDNGDFASYGIHNAESTAQVLLALCALGVDGASDSRFVRNGQTVFDGLRRYRLEVGSFCHKSGGGFSSTATVQVFTAMVAYRRMQDGKPGFFLLDAANPSAGRPSASDTSEPSALSPSSVGDSSAPPAEYGEPTPSAEVAVSSSVSSGSPAVQGTENTPSDRGRGGEARKLWVSLAVVLAGGAVCAWLFWKKKTRSVGNYLLVLAVCAAAAGLVLVTDFQTAGEYYGDTVAEESPAVGTVTLSVRCDSIPDKGAEHIPQDGVLLERTEYAIQDGDTVYDVLLKATRENRIHLETGGVSESVYVKGIGNIYEFDFGDLSGWIYRVNGEMPSVSCGEYTLSAGDEVEWLYTCGPDSADGGG